MAELKDKILTIMEQVKSGNFEIDIVNKTKTIPIMLLFIKTDSPPIDDMKKVIEELRNKREILLYDDLYVLKMFKDYLRRDLTENETFMLSYVTKL